MITYRILEANSAKELERMINYRLGHNNCTLIGGVAVIRSQWATLYCQAITIDVQELE